MGSPLSFFLPTLFHGYLLGSYRLDPLDLDFFKDKKKYPLPCHSTNPTHLLRSDSTLNP